MAVEIDRGVDLLHQRVGLLTEASAPHLVGHDGPPRFAPMTEFDSLRRSQRGTAAASGSSRYARLPLCWSGVYGIGRLRSNPAEAACRPAVTRRPGLRRWSMAKWRRSRWRTRRSASRISPSRMPKEPRTLTDWRGRTVLLNLWATWCVPCRKEMPALDALEGESRRPEISKSSPSTSTPATRRNRRLSSSTSASSI